MQAKPTKDERDAVTSLRLYWRNWFENDNKDCRMR
jgi:hypothetical protein